MTGFYFISIFLCLWKGKAPRKNHWLWCQSLPFKFYSAAKVSRKKTPFPSECGKLRFPLSNSADFVCLQWLVGNVVQRDDALYARMKQREIDAYDSMWDPIFVDDAALGLGEQRNKVLEVLKVKTNFVINLSQSRSEENAVVFVHFFDFYRFLKQLWSSLPPLCFSLSWFALHAFSWQTWLSSLISADLNLILTSVVHQN